MWKKLEEFRNKYQMFSAGDVVIAGVSGGADSMCLLCVLDKWKKEIGFELIVVHVNHGLRGTVADQDEAYVKCICEERGIPFCAYHIDVARKAAEEHLSEEEAGRNARREAFEEVLASSNGTKIALAHHKNDNVETFFLHLARGSKLKGLGGMRPVNGVYVRPLLGVTREEIEHFLAKNQMKYCMDESNDTDIYTRNRIRRNVIPYLEAEVNEKAVEHINQTMQYLQEVQNYLEMQVECLWGELVEETRQGLFVKLTLLEQPALIRKLVIRKMISQVAGMEKDLQEVHVEAVEQLLYKQTGRSLNLPYQIVAARTYEGVKIEQQKEAVKSLPTRMFELVTSSFVYESWKVEIRVFEKTEESVEPPKKRFTKWFDYDIINKNVCIRGKLPGDRIVISENGHSQKVKQFFINEKIPQELRKQIPIIAEGNQVLWVVGYRQSKAYQVTEQTRMILEIKINGGKDDVR